MKLQVLIITVLCISFVTAGFGIDDNTLPKLNGEDLSLRSSINYSTVNTNYSDNSGLLQGLTPQQVADLFDSSGLVPYSGATTNVNLNNKNLSGIRELNTTKLRVGLNNQINGSFSTALGIQNFANGYGSVAIGDVSLANGTSSTAIGFANRCYGKYSVCLGQSADAYGQGAISMSGGKAYADDSLAIGGGITNGANSFAIGMLTQANGSFSTALGGYGYALGDNSVAISGSIGHPAIARGFNSFAFGVDAQASDDNCIAMGAGTNCTYNSGVALGPYNTAGFFSVAIGNGCNASGEESACIGLFKYPYTTSERSVTQNNTLGILGGYVAINRPEAYYRLHVRGNVSLNDSLVVNENGNVTFYGGLCNATECRDLDKWGGSSGSYQPLENQRLSTTDNITFARLALKGYVGQAEDYLNITNASGKNIFRISGDGNITLGETKKLQFIEYPAYSSYALSTPSGTTSIYICVNGGNPVAGTCGGYFTSVGFNYFDGMGMALGSNGNNGKSSIIWGEVSTQKNGTGSGNWQVGYIGVTDRDYLVNSYPKSRVFLFGDASNYSINRKFTDADLAFNKYPQLLFLPPAGETRVMGSVGHDNSSLIVTTNLNKDITLNPSGKLNITSQIHNDNATAWAGYAMCYTTAGNFGHCTTTVGAGGTCTCVDN